MSREFRYQVGDDVRAVVVVPKDGYFEVQIGDQVLNIAARTGPNGRIDLECDGRRLRAYVAGSGQRQYVSLAGDTWTLAPPDPWRLRRGASHDGGGSLEAAMPGRVLDVLVAEGDRVAKGDTLVLLEAMKMELRVTAPADGTVTQVHVAAGQVVARGERLLEIGE